MLDWQKKMKTTNTPALLTVTVMLVVALPVGSSRLAARRWATPCEPCQAGRGLRSACVSAGVSVKLPLLQLQLVVMPL